MPGLQRLRWLNVVMPIEKNCEGFCGDDSLCENQRMAFGLHDLDVHTGLLQHVGQKTGAFTNASILGTDTRLPEQSEQGIKISLLVLLNAIEKIV